MPDDSQPILRIGPEEVASARVPPQRTAQAAPQPVAPPGPALSHLAVASLALAVVGVPLVGCLLGPIAIFCGALALARIQPPEQRGTGLAIAGIVLGAVEFVGWIVGLWILLSRPATSVGQELESPFFAARPALDIANAPAHIRRALRANVRVECANRNGMATGAGVVVARSSDLAWIATNRHVARCDWGDDRGTLRVVASDGAQSAAEIRWLAPDAIDVALLRTTSHGDIAAVDLARRGAKVGDPVFVIGNPLGLASTYTAGAISALRAIPAGARSVHVFQVQAGVNQGNSGGGLYTRDGELLGLVTWAADKRLAEGVGFAIAVSDIVELLEGAGEVWQEFAAARTALGKAP